MSGAQFLVLDVVRDGHDWKISTQYGHRFEDWPKALADGYWKAYRRAMEATEPLRKKLRERDY